MWLLFFTVLGSAVGSFLNVAIDRLPRGQSIVFPPSYCENCQRRLKPWDNIPVFSFLWLRGRCRYCRMRISPRILAVEVATAGLFAFLWWRYGFSIQLLLASVYTCAFLVLAVIDLEHKLLLNIIVLPTLALALLASPFWPGLDIWRALAGGAIGFVLLLLPRLAFPSGMGWGDVKMAALIGAVTGFPLVFLAIWLALLGGGLTAVVLLISRIKGRKDLMPFGPFLAAGALIALYWGGPLLDKYLELSAALFGAF